MEQRTRRRSNSFTRPGLHGSQRIPHDRSKVDGATAIDGNQGDAVALSQRIIQVVDPVSSIQWKDDGADLDDGEENEQKLGPVGDPDRDMLAVLYPRIDERLCDLVHLGI